MPTKKADKTVQVVDPQATSPAPKPAKRKTGPKLPVWADVSSEIEHIKSLSPGERAALRTQRGEELADLFLIRACERMRSGNLRSQDMVVISQWMKSNEFIIKPDTSSKEDALSKMVREKKEREAEESLRLRRMEAARKKNEKRAEDFYQRVQNPTEPTKRLNTGPSGAIGISEGEYLEEGNNNE